MNADERNDLQTAIETMVLFDIKLMNWENNEGEDGQEEHINSVAKWTPDLASLVCFGNNSRLFMKPKTQTLIL